jgi:hypothetical protein
LLKILSFAFAPSVFAPKTTASAPAPSFNSGGESANAALVKSEAQDFQQEAIPV